jgi:hypothetical protein
MPDHERTHERIEELLAGYALLALDGEDAAEADRLLTEHVPGCATCRRTLAELQAATGDLGLAAEPVDPGDLVLARIRHGIEEVPRRGASPRRGAFVALAASLVALLAMGGLSLTMSSRATRAEDQREVAIRLLSLMRSPGVAPNPVEPTAEGASAPAFLQVSSPDVRRMYLVADLCPDPAPGHAYQAWLGDGGLFTPVGEMFVPNDGVVLLELTEDDARYDEIWITEERVGTVPRTPNASGRSWRAPLT